MSTHPFRKAERLADLPQAPDFPSITEVEIVLVEAGPNAGAVAGVLQQLMNLTIPDPEALYTAIPFTLFRRTQRVQADLIKAHLQAAGAEVELRTPRDSSFGPRLPGLVAA